MSKILITGTGGFVAHALAVELSKKHEVVGLDIARKEITGVTTFQCDFGSIDDLAQLDTYEFDVCLHLAAVTGLGTEEQQLRVNLMGTRQLLRYLIDRKCKKFVLLSSIAAAGVLGEEFQPQSLPLPDDHPCMALDGYGFSKYLMEELARFICRQDKSLDIKVIRSCGIRPDGELRDYRGVSPPYSWGLASISPMYISDAVPLLAVAVEAPIKPGFRLMNSAGHQACVLGSVAEVMRARYGDHADTLDLAQYERPGHEFDPVVSLRAIQDEWGFTPQIPQLESPAPRA